MYENIVQQINQEIANYEEVKRILTGTPPKKPSASVSKRTMSAVGKASIVAAQKKRWAKQKKKAA
jgi:hypothetical protein